MTQLEYVQKYYGFIQGDIENEPSNEYEMFYVPMGHFILKFLELIQVFMILKGTQ